MRQREDDRLDDDDASAQEQQSAGPRCNQAQDATVAGTFVSVERLDDEGTHDGKERNGNAEPLRPCLALAKRGEEDAHRDPSRHSLQSP